MPKSSKEVLKLLEKNGWRQVAQKGSHIKLRHPDGRVTTVPEGRKDLGKGLIAAIERQTGLRLR